MCSKDNNVLSHQNRGIIQKCQNLRLKDQGFSFVHPLFFKKKSLTQRALGQCGSHHSSRSQSLQKGTGQLRHLVIKNDFTNQRNCDGKSITKHVKALQMQICTQKRFKIKLNEMEGNKNAIAIAFIYPKNNLLHFNQTWEIGVSCGKLNTCLFNPPNESYNF